MEALVVVDMLNDFVESSGSLLVPNAYSIVHNINRLISRFAKDNLVVFVRDSHTNDDPEFKLFPPHCIKGTTGAEIYPGILPLGSQLPKMANIEKVTFSAFSNKKMVRVLRENNIDNLFVCGVVTEICVKATTLDALEYGYDVAVINDAVMHLDEANGLKAKFEMLEKGAMLINTFPIVDAYDKAN